MPAEHDSPMADDAERFGKMVQELIPRLAKKFPDAPAEKIQDAAEEMASWLFSHIDHKPLQ